jgi:ParB/Sulfiredoxin domain
MTLKWKNEKRQVADLIPMENNPRRLTDKQRADLEKSLERFGLADPILVNLDGTVIGGHQRLKVLAAAGIKTADVRVPERTLTEEEADELNLRLNKNTGEWDLDLLAEYFDESLLADVGFSDSELEEIFKGVEDSCPDVDDSQEDLEPSDTSATIGAFRFKIKRDVYDTWLESMRQEVGFDDASVISEIKRRLQL